MAGVPVPEAMDGVDLSRFFDGPSLPERDYAWGGYGNSFFVRTDRWKAFGRNYGDELHLYDPRSDRRETRDLVRREPRQGARAVRRGARAGRWRAPVLPGDDLRE